MINRNIQDITEYLEKFLVTAANPKIRLLWPKRYLSPRIPMRETTRLCLRLLRAQGLEIRTNPLGRKIKPEELVELAGERTVLLPVRKIWNL